ncbi:hypothetical protein SUGI_0693800 [Cryptomeria japonica]|nr:hypothetical protein SUGI_0693800 [Cryptomeria japonica]
MGAKARAMDTGEAYGEEDETNKDGDVGSMFPYQCMCCVWCIWSRGALGWGLLGWHASFVSGRRCRKLVSQSLMENWFYAFTRVGGIGKMDDWYFRLSSGYHSSSPRLKDSPTRNVLSWDNDKEKMKGIMHH